LTGAVTNDDFALASASVAVAFFPRNSINQYLLVTLAGRD
jgi:hypothetical protein